MERAARLRRGLSRKLAEKVVHMSTNPERAVTTAPPAGGGAETSG